MEDKHSSHQSSPEIEKSFQWILDDLFNNKEPNPDDLKAIPPGALSTITSMLMEAWTKGGEVKLKPAFKSLCQTYPWLAELKSKTVPPRPEEPKPRRIKFVRDSDVENMPVRQWLVPGILPQNGIALLYAEPGTFKSFLAIDWALCMGYGYGWLGKEIKTGGVAYIAGEGMFGIGARIKAWKSYHGKSGDSEVRWYGECIPLTDAASVAELIIALDEDFPDKPKLVIIDTLSRNSGGADENSNTEMAKIIAAADQLQQRYGCSVLIIHHCGKDKGKGPRGASALIGNMETIISIDATDNGIKVWCYKQKDAAQFEPIYLKLQPVMYGENPEETSGVLVKAEAPIEEEDETKVSTKNSVQKMYELLIGKELTASEWIEQGMKVGVKRTPAYDARKELYETGKVQCKNSRYYIPEDKTPQGKFTTLSNDMLKVLRTMPNPITRQEWMQAYRTFFDFDVNTIKDKFNNTIDELLMKEEICCEDNIHYTARK